MGPECLVRGSAPFCGATLVAPLAPDSPCRKSSSGAPPRTADGNQSIPDRLRRRPPRRLKPRPRRSGNRASNGSPTAAVATRARSACSAALSRSNSRAVAHAGSADRRKLSRSPAKRVVTPAQGSAKTSWFALNAVGCVRLLPGYKLDRSVFLWAQDGQAMTHLQSISALHTAAKSVSEKVGRPWIESTFNGIRLGPRQFPDIWIRAVLAARILGLPRMPDVYISGDSQWNTYTYGTDTSAFIVLGTAILNNFQNDDLLFVLAREMGHCRAGHALWKTVARFLVGDDSVRKGLLSGGVINAISLSPTKWIQDAVDMPLMAWSRQADITADRAALLAIGDEALARRVILAWSIRSATAPEASQHRGMDEAGRSERRSDDALLRNDDHFLDVHHAASAAAQPVGPRARADALEPDHSAGSQAPDSAASAANIGRDGCLAWHPAPCCQPSDPHRRTHPHRRPLTPSAFFATSVRPRCAFRLRPCAASRR